MQRCCGLFGVGVVGVGCVVWVKTDGIWSKPMVKCHGQNPWLASWSNSQIVSQSVERFGMIITGQIGWFGWMVVVVKNRTKYRSERNS